MLCAFESGVAFRFPPQSITESYLHEKTRLNFQTGFCKKMRITLGRKASTEDFSKHQDQEHPENRENSAQEFFDAVKVGG